MLTLLQMTREEQGERWQPNTRTSSHRSKALPLPVPPNCPLFLEEQMKSVSASQRQRLEELEAIIQKGLKTFCHVGMALMQIRDEKLYLERHRTFEEYCQQK